LNLDPSDLCLWSSWDYRHEPPAPGSVFLLCGRPGVVERKCRFDPQHQKQKEIKEVKECKDPFFLITQCSMVPLNVGTRGQ
jgi:hypothetical protein